MKKVEYSDIVFLKKINEIKTTIRNSGFRIDFHRAYLVDQQMRELIDNLYNPDKQDSYLISMFKKLNMNVENKSNLLSYYYFALYQDNLDLLSSLLSNQVCLFDSNRSFLELLDRDFTKYFSKDEYLFLVANCREELKTFYSNVFAKTPIINGDERKKLIWELKDLYDKLFVNTDELSEEDKKKYESRLEQISTDLKTYQKYRYDDETRDKLCRDFVSILRQNPFICKPSNNSEEDYEVYSSLLVPNVIQLYGVDGILEMNEFQKKLVHENSSYPAILERLKLLFEKYPDYASPIHLNREVLTNFSNDELYEMPEEDIPLFEKAAEEGTTTRYKMVLKSNSALHNYPCFIDSRLFDTFSNDEITGLSEKAISRISNLVVNTRKFEDKDKMKLVRTSIRIMKRDRFIQKVKKFLT